jgi:hypoxanthine phosphoribosyltransferase|tara:strand:+ start:9873 stop:10460 length:588 start_codon:yes stop_codon:yes gene_type:complete
MEDSRIMTGNGNIVGVKKFVGDSTQHPNFDNSKTYRGWGDWDEHVSILCDKLEKDSNISSDGALFVYGIPRGGVTLSTMISHRLGIPMVSDAPSHWMLDWYHWRMRQSIELKSTSRTIIVADAICDSGKTIDYLDDAICNVIGGTKNPTEWNIIKAVVDVDPKVEKKVDYHVNIKDPNQWLVYPWEVGSLELKTI